MKLRAKSDVVASPTRQGSLELALDVNGESELFGRGFLKRFSFKCITNVIKALKVLV